MRTDQQSTVFKKLSRQDKVKFISSYICPENSIGLEIGPNISPLFPRKEGFQVEYVESISTQELKDRCVNDGKDPNRVEPIDYIFQRDKGLVGTVDKINHYDYVVSSHVIEHIPDIVTHLHEVSQVLNDTGLYGLIIPDKYLCFDYLKPPSTIGQILQAYMEKRTKPPISSYIDEIRYGTMLSSSNKGAWSISDNGELQIKYQSSHKKIASILSDTKHTESWFGHTWFFSCESFLSIFNDLKLLNLTDLEMVDILPTGHMDFIVILGKKQTKYENISYEKALESIKKVNYFTRNKFIVSGDLKPLTLS